MKSEWEFKFEARNFRFEKEHEFKATTNEPVVIGDWSLDQLEFFVQIVPSVAQPPPLVEQVGSLFITLPYPQSETKSFAYYVARIVADQITFLSGDFRINYGLVFCKRIAETPEEKAEFGDKLYSAELRLQEVIPAAIFDSGTFAQMALCRSHPGLISQYNETKRDSSPIRQFLGFFRILESLYHLDDKKRTLKQALYQSSELRGVFASMVDNGDFDTFVKNIVDIRHRCAHLKLGAGFGYVPADPAIENEVRPYLALLAMITRICITSPEEPAE